ncbi:ABC transporter permease [Croceivirga thetidis]|uniref:FtsX-like permease family protein n=1 Tax=Croceivirga thetidis TaxID=2721623 RepID=A0ABX1GQG8_9FLAO|nr:ABC transporter permease [Croceivirga thetidis]NKI32177.1 FtsX-like permease family protein [Croceivirga thetidis]
MSILYLAFRNLISKPLNLILSLLLLVLSVSLVTFILQLTAQMNEQMDKNIAPIDMVVGAKGSPLQLVLSSVLHIDTPTGNIKLDEAEKIMKHPFVGSAIPVSYGDNYKGYRILGTELEYFEQYDAEIASGKLYENTFEIVAGSAVANNLGLKIGDKIVSSHGLAATAVEAHEDKPFTIVGILKPTGTVTDQLLVSNLESVWAAHDHSHEDEGEDHNHEDHDHDEHDHSGEEHNHEDHDHDDHEHDDHDHAAENHDHEGEEHEHNHAENLEITSLLIKFKSPLALVQMPRFINENTNMQAALPGFEIQRLMGLLGSGAKTINGIALAILLVSGLSIFISLLKTIRERRQELALLRTYGLGTAKLLTLVLLEGVFLAIFGFLLGWLFGRLALVLASKYVESGYGYVLQINGPTFAELLLLGATLLISIIAVILASTSIFKLNISKTLADA